MYQLVVLAHLLAAMTWVGGLLFIALVVAPATRQLPASERARLFGMVGRRFRVLGWSALAVLAATGLVLAGYRGVYDRLAAGTFPEGAFDALLLAKAGVVAVMLVVSALHDFWLGPASARLLGRPPAARLRRQASWLARLTALLALVIVALAVALTRGLPW